MKRNDKVAELLFLIFMIIGLAVTAMLQGCSITAERYKVPTITAHSDGNPERIAAYQCADGYWKARDKRGILWCDSSDNFDRYPLNQDEDSHMCEEGVAVVERRIGGDRWDCVTDAREIY